MNDSSLDDIVSDASSEEEYRIYKEIATRRNWLPLPNIVERVRLRFGQDADGDPAVWIILYIHDDLTKTDQEIAELSKLGDRLRDDIIEAKTGRWPFVRIEEDRVDATGGAT